MTRFISSAAALLLLALPCIGQNVEKWGCFETSFEASGNGNPFDVQFTATFSCDGKAIRVSGFYDGSNTFRIRFMPDHEGEWRYVTHSNLRVLDGKKGGFVCVPPSEGNHGPVRADGTNFKYADGTRYYPVGTTAYSWFRGPEGYAENTLKSLEESGFNKLRCIVFPQSLSTEYQGPWPFEKNPDGSWDFSRFNPGYFQDIETKTLALREIGVEADLILFHPYDRGKWGFDNMPLEVNLRYLRYMSARFGAFRHVWWSLANEWDGLRDIPAGWWDKYAECMFDADPYRHMLSIHGYTSTYYDYFKPWFTHCSIQDQSPVEGPGKASTVRNIYKKPVIFDEVCYEGNNGARWGMLSGQEMLYRIYNGLVDGCYVTHAECFNLDSGSAAEEESTNFLAYGGKFYGESWKRIGFLRSVLADLPNPLGPADSSWDHLVATAGEGYYILYFGTRMQEEWTFSLPVKNALYPRIKEGERFKVEILDTWNCTVSECQTVFEAAAPGRYRVPDVRGRGVQLPLQPYLILRIKRI